EVVLLGNGLQQCIVRPRLQRADGRRVALEHMLGEGIDLEELQLHGVSTLFAPKHRIAIPCPAPPGRRPDSTAGAVRRIARSRYRSENRIGPPPRSSSGCVSLETSLTECTSGGSLRTSPAGRHEAFPTSGDLREMSNE